MKTMIILVIILIIIFGIVGILFYINNNNKEIACTMEVKICDDGSSVSRNADLNCEFDACPDEENNVGEDYCVDLGCSSGSIYAGSINSDKYYECDCRWAKNINHENLICFKSDAEAVGEGRVKSEC